MKSKFYLFSALLLVVALLLSACSFSESTSNSNNNNNEAESPTDSEKDGTTDEEDSSPKVLRLNNGSEPGSLHPALAQGTHDSWILEHTFEGLTKKNAEGDIQPGMAKEWNTEDGVTWTFTLKDDVYWSNGDPVTAEDFEYAWKHVLNPATAAQYSYQLYYLKGAEAYNSAEEGADLAALEAEVGVKAVDSKTLEVTLAQPTPYFLDLTSFYTYYPVNKKVQEANKDWALEAETHVSNGPFYLADWKHKESIAIKKNDKYYEKDMIKLDEVQFVIIDDENTAWQMYQADELDLVYPLPQDVQGQLMASDDAEFHIGPDLAVYYFNINNTEKPFNNAKIRKALSLAIDRQTIVEHVAQGGQTPAYSIVPPGIPDVNGDYQENTGKLFEENVDEAKKLLAEGLEEEGLDKLPSFVYLYNTSEGHKAIAEAVQEMWRKNLGVETTLENVEFQVKLDSEQAGDYTVSRAGWVGDYVDPMTFLDLWVSDGPYNDARFKNSEYDELISKAKSTLDQAERMEAMHAAEKILMDEMPIIPIYFYTKPYVLKPSVTGIYDPINSYPQFKYADIK
ncbi:peptide ABC transporter substrate-binding protein [Sutcliffiella sp. NPDC057660]|uniref:peptide ABC transporter substrate-binding protein n=1 Tax=Sutcliffiella sp. NPDC057660 TaxID=3346199 RepID=UPI00367B94BB